MQKAVVEDGGMKKFEVLVAGRGKLAAELLAGLEGEAISRSVPWAERAASAPDAGIAVHAGSGRELPALIDYCAEKGALLFELSTAEAAIPDTVTFPVILCPNVNLQMLRFMAMVRQASGLFKGQPIRITESHQATKTTKPGTAIYLAKQLGVPESEIRSERDPQRQEKILGIPEKHLARHAYHNITIKNSDAEITLETRVLGKTAYAAGLSRIIAMVARLDLAPGRHDIVDIVTGQVDGRP